ncbi:MAG: hypothetical protein AAFO81_00530 [Pseudomonadota bacterium]
MQGISERQIATLATRIAARATLFSALGADLSAPRSAVTGVHLNHATLTSDSAYRLLTHAAANWLTQMTASTKTIAQQAAIPMIGSKHGLPLETLVQALREVFSTDRQRYVIDQAHERLSQQLPVVLERIASIHGLPPSIDPIAVWLLPLLQRRNRRNSVRSRRGNNERPRSENDEQTPEHPQSAQDEPIDVAAETDALLDVVSWLAQAAYADEYAIGPARQSAPATGSHLSEYA